MTQVEKESKEDKKKGGDDGQVHPQFLQQAQGFPSPLIPPSP